VEVVIDVEQIIRPILLFHIVEQYLFGITILGFRFGFAFLLFLGLLLYFLFLFFLPPLSRLLLTLELLFLRLHVLFGWFLRLEF
jgi:hypothetical protein